MVLKDIAEHSKSIFRSEGTVFRRACNLNIFFQCQIYANFENYASFELQSRFYGNLSGRKCNRVLQAYYRLQRINTKQLKMSEFK